MTSAGFTGYCGGLAANWLREASDRASIILAGYLVGEDLRNDDLDAEFSTVADNVADRRGLDDIPISQYGTGNLTSGWEI